MSRVIVKGLPIYYDEDKLRKVFSEDGPVTDVKLVRKRNGQSRRFAFIGFKTMEDAERVVKFRDGTYIDTAKVTVQLAKTMRDPTLPLSWRERRKQQRLQERKLEEDLKRQEELQKSVRLRKKEQQSRNKTVDEKIKSNPELQEYMETTKTHGEGRSWNNDEVINPDDAPSVNALEKTLEKKEEVELKQDGKANDDKSSGGESSSESDDDLDNDKDDSNNEDIKRKSSNDVQNENQNIDDLEWFKSKRVLIPEKHHPEEESDHAKKDGKEEEEEEHHHHHHHHHDHHHHHHHKDATEEDDHENLKSEHPTAIKKPERKSQVEIDCEEIEKTGRLFLRNILYTSTESDFQTLFESYGELKELHVAVDSRTGASKGFAYVQFKNPSEAITAYKELEGSIFQGRLLHIIAGKPKKETGLDEFVLKNMPLKKQKFLRRKYGAAKQQFSWNSLYMNNDAVLESVASEMGISKSELIDPESSSSAVKQALAEAHVIGDVRKYFEGKGVDLTKFQGKEKDDRVILVKNFQHGTTKEEIGEKFAMYGKLNRILMPPAGTIAIVEFRDAPSGRSAFNKLSFKRLGKSILYLEKGPKDLFVKEPEDEDQLITESKDTTGVENAKVSSEDLLSSQATNENKIGNSNDDVDVDDDVPEGSTVSIFVKNLNFSTTVKDLEDLFKPLDGFCLAVVKQKPDAKHPGRMLSMGFGFVEFKNKAYAQAAISTMDGFVLSGHKLQLKISTRSSGNGSSTKRKRSSKSTKIIVKNLPFEASRNDVFQLFSSFAHLKSVRVPKKFDRSARGFAFVEFNTVKEAETVMDQLQGVHLLGRRLVLDFAEKNADNAEEEISRMTKKARKQVNATKLAGLREMNEGKRELDLESDGE